MQLGVILPGVVEAICITMLVGLSVDYATHLAESYMRNGLHEGPDTALRGCRVLSGLAHVGPPILHSAITTAGMLGVAWAFGYARGSMQAQGSSSESAWTVV